MTCNNTSKATTLGIILMLSFLSCFASRPLVPKKIDCQKIKKTLLDKKLSVVFIRHGKTDWSKEYLALGPQDLSLNEEGIKQTKVTALRLATLLFPLSTVYSSPLKRAMDTAKILVKSTAAIKVIPEFKERYFGDYRLLSKTEIQDNVTPSDAESATDFQNRVCSGFHQIIQKHDVDQPLIIISHAKVFQLLSRLLTDLDEKLSFSEIAIFQPHGALFSMEKYQISPSSVNKL